MKLKTNFTRFRKLLSSGDLARESPQLASALHLGLHFSLGLVLSAVPLLGGCGPFGIAIAAQAGAQAAGLLCAAGAVLGYLSMFGFAEGLQSVSAVALVFAASYVFQGHKYYRSFWFMPLLAGLFALTAGLLGALTTAPFAPVQTLLRALLRAVLAAGRQKAATCRR